MQSSIKKAIAVASLAAAVASVAHGADAKWYDDVKFKGDLRYRYQREEVANVEDSINRLRFRYGAYGKVNDSTKFGFRLATGKAEDGDSRNLTLGNTTAGKEPYQNRYIGLDLAYVTIDMVKDLSATFGKMDNPFWSPQNSQLTWDGDYTPEGIALQYSNKNFFVNTSYFTESGGATANTAAGSQELGGIQLGFTVNGFTGAATYYTSSHEYANTTTSLKNGSSAYDIGLEYAFKLGETKAAIYADYFSNSDSKDTAGRENQDYSYLVGLNLSGKEWKFGLGYLDSGDIGVSGLQDSDFNGGKADSEGYKISGGYKFAKNSEAALTYFVADQSVSTAKVDYKCLQADLVFKF
jgi:hypothetical protein